MRYLCLVSCLFFSTGCGDLDDTDTREEGLRRFSASLGLGGAALGPDGLGRSGSANGLGAGAQPNGLGSPVAAGSDGRSGGTQGRGRPGAGARRESAPVPPSMDLGGSGGSGAAGEATCEAACTNLVECNPGQFTQAECETRCNDNAEAGDPTLDCFARSACSELSACNDPNAN